MKRFMFAAFLFMGIAAFSQDKNETAIRKLMDEQSAAWNKGDIDGFMHGYWESDSLMFIGKSGVTYGWNNTLKNYKKGYPDVTAMGTLQFTLIKVQRISSRYYHVTGKWYLKRTIGDLSGHYTLLFHKLHKRWVIVSDHSS